MFRLAIAALARLVISLWWHVRIDPSRNVRRGSALFAASTTLVISTFSIVTVLSNLLLGSSFQPTTTAIAAIRSPSPIDKPSPSPPPTTKAPKPKKPPVLSSSGPVPGTLFATYVAAARSCDMRWEVLAAVGWVESHHGELVAPGVKSGANFAGARGPMQFLSATWNRYGVDANNDGKADVYDPQDSIHGASKYLCANGAGDPGKLRNALFRYNHSNAYVDEVLAVARRYSEQTYLLPIAKEVASDQLLGAAHHDYPAVDIMAPVGTPITAAHGGKVANINDGRCGLGAVITGYDGATYTYCHLTQLFTKDQSLVSAGDLIGASGGAAGDSGAGSSSTPHLHLQIDVNGHKVCPQPLLKAWRDGQMATPATAPSSGCVT